MICVRLLVTLCSLSLLPETAKEKVAKPFPAVPFATTVSSLTVYSSGWESVPAWQLAEETGPLLYTYSRSLEQVSAAVLKKGVVVVFAKGYDFEGVFRAEEKPLGLPFYITMANENISHPYAWSFTANEGNITIGVSMDAALKRGFEAARKDIRLRFFVLPPEFLRQHKLNAIAVRKMPYNQLVSLLKTTP